MLYINPVHSVLYFIFLHNKTQFSNMQRGIHCLKNDCALDWVSWGLMVSFLGRSRQPAQLRFWNHQSHDKLECLHLNYIIIWPTKLLSGTETKRPNIATFHWTNCSCSYIYLITEPHSVTVCRCNIVENKEWSCWIVLCVRICWTDEELVNAAKLPTEKHFFY